MLFFFLVQACDLTLSIADLKNAFCQSNSLDRCEGLDLPPESLIQLVARVYGLNDAPRFDGLARQAKLSKSLLKPCVYAHYAPASDPSAENDALNSCFVLASLSAYRSRKLTERKTPKNKLKKPSTSTLKPEQPSTPNPNIGVEQKNADSPKLAQSWVPATPPGLTCFFFWEGGRRRETPPSSCFSAPASPGLTFFFDEESRRGFKSQRHQSPEN